MIFSSPYLTMYLIDSIITLFIRFHFRVTDPSSLFILVRFCSTGVSGTLKRVFQVIDRKTVTLSQCEIISLILSEKSQNNVKRHLNRSTWTHNLTQTYIKGSYDFLNVILISCLWASLDHVSIWVVLVHPWINLFIPEPLNRQSKSSLNSFYVILENTSENVLNALIPTVEKLGQFIFCST